MTMTATMPLLGIRAIVNASTDDERVARVEEFLLTRYRPTEPNAVVGAALRAISAAAGAIRVRTLAKDLGISQDALEKHFRRIVGATPSSSRRSSACARPSSCPARVHR